MPGEIRRMSLPYLIYKRVRAGFGITFGFILMYGVLTSSIGIPLLAIAAGFLFIHLFGDLYNDSCDYEEDRKNMRKDKLTLNGNVDVSGMRKISFIAVAAGSIILFSVDILLFLVGLYYAVMLFAYSNPRIRLKNYHYWCYLLAAGTVWPPIVFGMNLLFSQAFSLSTIMPMAFFSSQFFYILCQKDSTDKKDIKNIFISNSWNTAWSICVFSAVFAITAFSGLIYSAAMLIPLFINIAAKFFNLSKIRDRTITRQTRGRLMLVEFLTPYMYIVSSMVA